MRQISALARQLMKDLPMVHPEKILAIAKEANKCARRHGTNRATEIEFRDIPEAKVVEFDKYHAESRTGVRATMAALKRFWKTYHYVPTHCKVALPLIK